MIKESGYAGFEIPIHIYLKNKDEGSKKIEIVYDLILQSSGPAITNVMRHTEIINNPSEEFKRKLLRGGGVSIICPILHRFLIYYGCCNKHDAIRLL